ncbi:type II toxin-antitoxin system HigB family toxin [bacterium]|nr:MAG: type II toxin-antitoxin system HigB family toxin [bacterium]
MRIFARSTLQQFWERHPDCEDSLKAWFVEALHASWHSPQEIKQRYASADVLPDNRIVFNIKGNQYRLIVKIHYNTGMVFIRFIGTHAEYDRIDAEKI